MSEQVDDVKNFKFTKLINDGSVVKLPLSTLQSIRDKAIAAGADLTNFVADREIANVQDAIAKVSYIVGASKYYLGEDG